MAPLLLMAQVVAYRQLLGTRASTDKISMYHGREQAAGRNLAHPLLRVALAAHRALARLCQCDEGACSAVNANRLIYL